MSTINANNRPNEIPAFQGVKIQETPVTVPHTIHTERVTTITRPEPTWNIYGFLGLLVSVTSLISWLLVNSKPEACFAAAGSSYTHLQIFHAVAFFSGIVICLFGLLDLAHTTFESILFYFITVLIGCLSILMAFAAYYAYWHPCVETGRHFLPPLTPPDSRLYPKLAHDDILGHRTGAHNAHASSHSIVTETRHSVNGNTFANFDSNHHVFNQNDGKMISVFFLDILSAWLLVAAACNFFRRR